MVFDRAGIVCAKNTENGKIEQARDDELSCGAGFSKPAPQDKSLLYRRGKKREYKVNYLH